MQYAGAFFWWELMEMTRRVFLVGIMVLVMRGTLSQLVIASIFCLTLGLLQMQANPFAVSPTVMIECRCQPLIAPSLAACGFDDGLVWSGRTRATTSSQTRAPSRSRSPSCSA